MQRAVARESERILKGVFSAPHFGGWDKHRSCDDSRRVAMKSAVQRDNYIGLGVDVKLEAVGGPAAKALAVQIG